MQHPQTTSWINSRISFTATNSPSEVPQAIPTSGVRFRVEQGMRAFSRRTNSEKGTQRSDSKSAIKQHMEDEIASVDYISALSEEIRYAVIGSVSGRDLSALACSSTSWNATIKEYRIRAFSTAVATKHSDRILEVLLRDLIPEDVNQIVQITDNETLQHSNRWKSETESKAVSELSLLELAIWKNEFGLADKLITRGASWSTKRIDVYFLSKIRKRTGMKHLELFSDRYQFNKDLACLYVLMKENRSILHRPLDDFGDTLLCRFANRFDFANVSDANRALDLLFQDNQIDLTAAIPMTSPLQNVPGLVTFRTQKSLLTIVEDRHERLKDSTVNSRSLSKCQVAENKRDLKVMEAVLERFRSHSEAQKEERCVVC